jgi:hypothetical protein
MHWIYAHLIGDYLLQNDWMAKGKKNFWWIAVIHVICYMIPFIFTGTSFLQFLLIAAQHLIQDKTNFIIWLMNIKGSAKFAEPPMAPWSIIITDNIIHILWIAFVMNLEI